MPEEESDPRFENPFDRGIDHPRDAKEFLGVGWKFPPQLDGQGRIALISYDEDIAEAIPIILRTQPGERPMRPLFGCDLFRLLFAPCNRETANRAEIYVRDALEMWEPRILLRDVKASPHSEREATLLIEIEYTIRATNEERNLVAPFYLIPGDGVTP